MRRISDAFLLNVAEISAALVGLFLVGMFFFIETGFRRITDAREVFEPYFRSSTRIVLVLYAIPILLPLTLVAMEPAWSRGLLIVLSLVLVAANLDTVRRIRPVARASSSVGLAVNEALGTVAVVAIVFLPWILGGFNPTREDITWSILIAFFTGFLSISALVLSAFDLARLEEITAGEGARSEDRQVEPADGDETTPDN